MRSFLLLVLLPAPFVWAQAPGTPSSQQTPSSSAQTSAASGLQNSAEAALQEKLTQIAASGRVQLIGANATARLQRDAPLTPGAPPILAFRYFDGQARHRFGDLDLVMDDAGH